MLRAVLREARPRAVRLAAPARSSGRFATPRALWQGWTGGNPLRRSTSSARPQLNQYVQELACRLAGDHCPDIRVNLVSTPQFNASMAPNGMMQVWTGLLLRVENEAQLTAILGHEIGHYLARHSVERMRQIKSGTAVGQFLALFGGRRDGSWPCGRPVRLLAGAGARSGPDGLEISQGGYDRSRAQGLGQTAPGLSAPTGAPAQQRGVRQSFRKSDRRAEAMRKGAAGVTNERPGRAGSVRTGARGGGRDQARPARGEHRLSPHDEAAGGPAALAYARGRSTLGGQERVSTRRSTTGPRRDGAAPPETQRGMG